MPILVIGWNEIVLVSPYRHMIWIDQQGRASFEPVDFYDRLSLELFICKNKKYINLMVKRFNIMSKQLVFV